MPFLDSYFNCIWYIKKDTARASPTGAARASGKNYDMIMSDAEGHKSKEEKFKREKVEEGTNKDKVVKNTPATPTKRLSSLKETFKFIDEGPSNNPLSKGIDNKSSPVYFKP